MLDGTSIVMRLLRRVQIELSLTQYAKEACGSMRKSVDQFAKD